MSLDAIPIHVIHSAPGGAVDPAGLSGNAPPLLRELLEMVRRLLAGGETAAIDLSALPLTPADLDWLKHTLAWVDGQGRVCIDYRPVHLNTLTGDVEPVPPKARTY